MGFSQVDRVTNAEQVMEAVATAEREKQPYSLLLSDMHFDFMGKDDQAAGEKTWNLLKEKGYSIPAVFCSSQNWTISGALGNIFYNPQRDWETEAEQLFREIRKK